MEQAAAAKDLAEMSIAEFLRQSGISEEDWQAARCEWTDLQEIAADFECNRGALTDSAEFFAKTIQRFDGVHSVRWRVKDVSHLLAKIVRKRVQKAEKYKGISVSNYFEIVTDLVGIRALHLFKDDCFAIDGELRARWTTREVPIAYTRGGDDAAFVAHLNDQGFDVKVHSDGYRSLHYVLESKPMQRVICAEVQVRTLFEEGWSEIDHTVRYPNFSDNEMVGVSLRLLNRLAGSADEMGGYVRNLANYVGTVKAEIVRAGAENDRMMAEMEATLAKLASLETKDNDKTKLISQLKDEIQTYKKETSFQVTAANIARLGLTGHDGVKTESIPNALLRLLYKTDFKALMKSDDVAETTGLGDSTVRSHLNSLLPATGLSGLQTQAPQINALKDSLLSAAGLSASSRVMPAQQPKAEKGEN